MKARMIASLLVLLSVSACSSSAPKLAQPDIFVRAVGGAPPLRSGLSYGVTFEVGIRNRSGEPITLERIQLQSNNSMSYDIQSRQEVRREVIQPGETKTVSVFANAFVARARTAQSEPITLRVTALFNSPVGRFRSVVFRNLGSALGENR